MPFTFVDPSSSLRRLRTTPARKPRTECGCQPVAFITAAIVAPAGDCSIAITRDCFDPELTFSGLVSPAVRLDGLADGADDADFEGDRFFADFDIEILRSVDDGLAPHHRSPTSAIKPAGQDLRAP